MLFQFLRKSLKEMWVLLALAIWPWMAQAQTSTITIQVDQPGAVVSSNLFGIFFEEINFGGDGGI